MTDLAMAAERKLDLARVWRDTLAVTGRRPVFVVGLSFLLAGVPNYFGGMFAAHHMHSGFYFVSVWGLLHTFVLMFVGSFLTASLYRLSIAELQGETPAPAEVFTTGAQLFLPLFAVHVMVFVGVVLGLILLVVPGVMLGLAWCMAGPALIAEQSGITQSFTRSADLTRGNRWRLFAMFLIFGLAMAIIQSVFGAVGLAVSYASPAFFSGPRLLGSAILATVSTALAGPGVAATYLQLRELKGG